MVVHGGSGVTVKLLIMLSNQHLCKVLVTIVLLLPVYLSFYFVKRLSCCTECDVITFMIEITSGQC